MLAIFLSLALAISALGDPYDWSQAKKEKSLKQGVLGKIHGIPVRYRLGEVFTSPDSEVALELQWKHPNKKGCCTQEVFRSLLHGYSKKPQLQRGRIVWDLVFEEFADAEADEITRTASRFCWKLDAEKEQFVEDKKCGKEWAVK